MIVDKNQDAGESEVIKILEGLNELLKTVKPAREDERVKGTFPGMQDYFDVRRDGEEIVYQDNFYKRRFVFIENVFK